MYVVNNMEDEPMDSGKIQRISSMISTNPAKKRKVKATISASEIQSGDIADVMVDVSDSCL